jgi:hypothetical protein
MTKLRIWIIAIIAAGMIVGAQSAQAHCDSIDGPVAKAVQKALETGNINPVLAYAPASAQVEIRAAFMKSRKVRGLGADARELADHAFMETVIRLHRAGEGATYTGLKPAGIDYGPVIPAAEQAVETGDLAKLNAALMHEIDHALQERLARVRKLQKAPLEPKGGAWKRHRASR